MEVIVGHAMNMTPFVVIKSLKEKGSAVKAEPA